MVVRQAAEGDHLQAGVIYVAPPDRHLLVTEDLNLTLSKAALVHFVRPSADLLFESVAAACGAFAIAVVLSGTGYDGSQGVRAIKKMGGINIAQNQDNPHYLAVRMPDRSGAVFHFGQPAVPGDQDEIIFR